MKARKNNGGFTLIELIAVLIIVAILSVYAIARLNFTSTFPQKAVYDKVRAGVEYAGKAAVAQRRYVCVCIGSCSPANSVAFTIDTRAPETTGATFCDGSSSATLTLPVQDKDCAGTTNAICSRSGATIGASGAASFYFNPQGAASTTAGVTITGENNIASCGGAASAVCVTGVTGYVQ